MIDVRIIMNALEGSDDAFFVAGRVMATCRMLGSGNVINDGKLYSEAADLLHDLGIWNEFEGQIMEEKAYKDGVFREFQRRFPWYPLDRAELG